jgi:hypothetical protein
LAVKASITFWNAFCSSPDHSASTWIDFPDRSGSATGAAAEPAEDDGAPEEAEEEADVLAEDAGEEPPAAGLEELEEQPASARPEASPTASTAGTDRWELAPMISLLSSTRVRELLIA